MSKPVTPHGLAQGEAPPTQTASNRAGRHVEPTSDFDTLRVRPAGRVDLAFSLPAAARLDPGPLPGMTSRPTEPRVATLSDAPTLALSLEGCYLATADQLGRAVDLSRAAIRRHEGSASDRASGLVN